VPTTISPEPYELLGELAQGGMATVFIGRRKSRRSGRRRELVAIKSMKQELAEDEAFATMFLDEATLTARIKHPNVVQTLDVANEGGKLLIIMEYVPGVSLARLLELGMKSRQSIPPRIVCAIICDLLRGLHSAHELVDGNGHRLNVVHRDVSPQNVLVGTDGIARILDFGVAKASSQRHVTMRGEIKGKLAYMPPEQAIGEAVDPRADVYAAGVVLWESLVGRRLFTGKREEDIVAKIFEGTIDPPSMLADEAIPSAVDHVVLRALSRAREDRWTTASDMADRLANALSPAHHDEVAEYVQRAAHAELAQRAALVRELEEQSQPLDLESQTLQSILTGRAERGELVAAGMAPTRNDLVRSLPPPPAPMPRMPPSVPPPSHKPSRSSLRREHRRRRRRMRVMLGFAVAAIVILVLMTVALVLGRRAREAETPAENLTAPKH
jgi:serine/threonine-protein kinase